MQPDSIYCVKFVMFSLEVCLSTVKVELHLTGLYSVQIGSVICDNVYFQGNTLNVYLNTVLE